MKFLNEIYISSLDYESHVNHIYLIKQCEMFFMDNNTRQTMHGGPLKKYEKRWDRSSILAH